MKTLLVLLALLLGHPASSYAQELPTPSLQHKVVLQAKQDLCVREKTNRNDHPRIDEVLTYMRLPKGLPYCASFVVYWYNHAGEGKVLPKTGGVLELKRRMQADELHFRMIKTSDVLLGIVKLQEGDIPIWNYGGGKGHTGVVVTLLPPPKTGTIEANTQSGDKGNQREGGGIYQRVRTIKATGSARLEVFGRVRTED